MFVEIKNMNSISSSSSSSYSSSTKVMNKPLSQSSLFSLRYYNCNCNCNNISSSSIPFHSNFPPNNSMHFLLSLFFFFFLQIVHDCLFVILCFFQFGWRWFRAPDFLWNVLLHPLTSPIPHRITLLTPPRYDYVSLN